MPTSAQTTTQTEKQSFPLETWYKLCPDDLDRHKNEIGNKVTKNAVQANNANIDN